MFRDVIERVGQSLDLAGVVLIAAGAVLVAAAALIGLGRGQGLEVTYRSFRRGLGRAILLGLELLVAADIIRTVAVSPTFRSVGVLAGIVLIRTFLSFTLELETSGRWPWQPTPGREDHI